MTFNFIQSILPNRSQNNLGNCYNYGKGTDKMKKKAFEWYTKSAISGIEAQLNIGIYYNYGKGVDKNETKASEWFLKSAEGAWKCRTKYIGKFYHKAIYWYKSYT
ncbi:Sel1 repeat family protein [Rhizophagus irregularis DAOM 181602=DAOM 197198]|nr:Sel1 repeat family protein [Rhizophagus irregularis DAOM 181602=DAOM 197198]